MKQNKKKPERAEVIPDSSGVFYRMENARFVHIPYEKKDPEVHMALQLILGNSGAGKSHYMFEKIITQSIEEPKRQFFVIVPEQFTMQTQQKLVELAPNHAIMNIDV